MNALPLHDLARRLRRRRRAAAWRALLGLAALLAAMPQAKAGEPTPAATVALADAEAGETRATDSPLRWSTRAAFAGHQYQWQLSGGSLDFGMRFDTPARAGSVAESRLDAVGPLVQPLPALSLGLRSVDRPGGWLARASGTAPSVTRRFGIEWKPAESQLLFIRQGLGIHLDGDDRFSMRLKRGVLGLYYKRDF